MQPIHLTKAEALPKMQEAFRNGQLQAQKVQPDPNQDCLYAGPCIVGVCVPEELRPILDDTQKSGSTGTSCTALIRDGVLVISAEEKSFFTDAQHWHDLAVRSSGEREIALEKLRKHIGL